MAIRVAPLDDNLDFPEGVQRRQAARLADNATPEGAAIEAAALPIAEAAATRPFPSRAARPLVVFSFDDGWIRDMTVVKPILDSKGIKASFCMVTSYVSSDPARVTWDQVRQLRDEGHEIVNHSQTHIDMNITDQAVLNREMKASQSAFLAQGLRPTGFCWPFVHSSPAARKIARNTFRYALGGAGSVSQPLGTYESGRYALNGSSDLATVKGRVDRAKANNELLIFLTHSTSQELNEAGVENLKQIIDYVKASGVEITTADAALTQVGNLVDTESTVIDGSGRLFTASSQAAARMVWGGGGTITAATKPRDFELGAVTHNTVSVGNNTDWPESGYGNIVTHRLNNAAESYTIQWFYSATNKTYVRRGSSLDAWQAWTMPSGGGGSSSQTHFVVDLGSATYTNDPASSYPKGTTLQRVIGPNAVSPTGGPGLLTTNRAGVGYTSQEFVGYGTGALYRRSGNGNDVWLPWGQITATVA